METEKSTFGKANKHHKQPEFPPTPAELAICYCSSILVLTVLTEIKFRGGAQNLYCNNIGGSKFGIGSVQDRCT